MSVSSRNTVILTGLIILHIPVTEFIIGSVWNKYPSVYGIIGALVSPLKWVIFVIQNFDIVASLFSMLSVCPSSVYEREKLQFFQAYGTSYGNRAVSS